MNQTPFHLVSKEPETQRLISLPKVPGLPGTLLVFLSLPHFMGSVFLFITNFYCIMVHIIILALVLMVLERLSALEAKEYHNFARL